MEPRRRFTVSGIASSKPTNEIKPITAMMAKGLPVHKVHQATPESRANNRRNQYDGGDNRHQLEVPLSGRTPPAP